MMAKKVHRKIYIPRVNPYPFEAAKRWAKGSYVRARAQVSRRQAKEKKAEIPSKAFHYVVKMTFGLYRLTGPSRGQGKPARTTEVIRSGGSPLEIVLDLLKPYIVPALWGQFRKQFSRLLKQSFSSICHSNYNPTRVREKNDQIKQLLKEFALKEYDLHLDFVLHPDTAEFFLSPRFLEIRSKIREYFTGQPLDKSKYQRPQQADDPRQMDMHLDLQVTQKS